MRVTANAKITQTNCRILTSTGNQRMTRNFTDTVAVYFAPKVELAGFPPRRRVPGLDEVIVTGRCKESFVEWVPMYG